MMNLKKIKNKLNKEIEQVLTKLEIKYELFSDNIYSTCPVHENSDNPRAFSFSVDKGIWKCWTRDCQHEYKNDVFGLIQGALSLQAGKEVSFKEVMSWVSSNFNTGRLYSFKTTDQEQDEEVEPSIYELLEILQKQDDKLEDKALDYEFEVQLPSNYFYNRAFKKSTLRYFGVGDCDKESIMKDRAVIPIHNDDGSKIVGYIGRSTKEYKVPKFLLYPKGFEKRQYLYNYHRAKKEANALSSIYLLEGQGDVWKMYEAGAKNAVSIFGKTLSDQQEKKLRKLAVTNIVVLMDNDQAGKEARIQIQRQLGRMYTLTFPQLTRKDVGEMNPKEIKEQILEINKGIKR